MQNKNSINDLVSDGALGKLAQLESLLQSSATNLKSTINELKNMQDVLNSVTKNKDLTSNLAKTESMLKNLAKISADTNKYEIAALKEKSRLESKYLDDSLKRYQKEADIKAKLYASDKKHASDMVVANAKEIEILEKANLLKAKRVALEEKEARTKSKSFGGVSSVDVNSRTALKMQIDYYTKLRNNMDSTSKEFDKLGKHIDALNKKYKESGTAMERQRLNIGNYKSALSGVIGQMTSLITTYFGLTKILDSSRSWDRTKRSLSSMIPTAIEFNQTIEFLKTNADKYGISLNELADNYKNFYASTKGTNFEGKKTQEIFENINKAVAVLGLSTDDANGVFRAFSQIMSKGKVQAEELRLQLGDRLSGSFKLFADAIGVSVSELDDMMKKGTVLADDVIPKVSKRLNEMYGSGAEEASRGINGELGRLKTTIDSVGRDPRVIDFFTTFIRGIRTTLELLPSMIHLLTGLGAAIVMLRFREQINAISLVAKGFSEWSVGITGVKKAFRSLGTAGWVGLILSVAGAVWDIVNAMTGLSEAEKKVKDNSDDMLSKYKLLSVQFSKGTASIDEQSKMINEYNKSFGDLFGTVNSYEQLQSRLIDNSEKYRKQILLNAKALAYQEMAANEMKKSLDMGSRWENIAINLGISKTNLQKANEYTEKMNQSLKEMNENAKSLGDSKVMVKALDTRLQILRDSGMAEEQINRLRNEGLNAIVKQNKAEISKLEIMKEQVSTFSKLNPAMSTFISPFLNDLDRKIKNLSSDQAWLTSGGTSDKAKTGSGSVNKLSSSGSGGTTSSSNPMAKRQEEIINGIEKEIELANVQNASYETLVSLTNKLYDAKKKLIDINAASDKSSITSQVYINLGLEKEIKLTELSQSQSEKEKQASKDKYNAIMKDLKDYADMYEAAMSNESLSIDERTEALNNYHNVLNKIAALSNTSLNGLMADMSKNSSTSSGKLLDILGSGSGSKDTNKRFADSIEQLNSKFYEGKMSINNYRIEYRKLITEYKNQYLEDKIAAYDSEIEKIEQKNDKTKDEIALLSKLKDIRNQLRAGESEAASLNWWDEDKVKQWMTFSNTALSVINDIGSEIDKRYQIEIEQIENKRKLVEESYNAQIDLINKSGLSDREKAEKTALIQSKIAQENKQYEKDKLKIMRQQAKMQKAMAISSVIQSTSMAIISAWTLTPANPVISALQTAFVTALGGVQLANILATPLPAYAQGTNYHKGGKALVGEGGEREYIQHGDKTFVVDKPMILDLPIGSRVIPESKLRNKPQAYSSISVDKNGNFIIDLGGGFDKVVNAINNKKERPIHFPNHSYDYYITSRAKIFK